MSATKDIANSHPGSSQSQPSRRKEIYRYTAPEPLFASAWSNKLYPDKRFRMAVCTILTEERIDNNTLFVIELDEGVGELVARCVQKHGYPASAMRFIPNADPQAPELLATTSDHLRICRYEPEKPSLSEECNLYSNKSQAYCSPLTNLDWNVVDPSMVGTTSFDTTATIWNIEVGVQVGQVPASRPTITGNVRTQLIAHEKPVHTIAFTPIGNGRDHFGTAGADGSVRLFDLRSLQHSTILHEDPEKRALNHLAWNRLDATKLATVAHESNEVVVLDVRMPCRPIAKFRGHRDSINGIAWAPHSEVHLCTAGSDHQALIWQMNHFNDEPILAYNAEGEINQIHWASNLNQWISICFDNNLETLRV